jgi:hypothetical protein
MGRNWSGRRGGVAESTLQCYCFCAKISRISVNASMLFAKTVMHPSQLHICLLHCSLCLPQLRRSALCAFVSTNTVCQGGVDFFKIHFIFKSVLFF